MLVLNRKKNESIIIGNNIEIKILKISPNCVQIGVDAPQSLSIFRDEVFKEIKKQNLVASKSIDNQKITNIADMLQKLNTNERED